MASNDRSTIQDDRDAGDVVGLSLKELRLAAGITQTEMAERLGVGQAAISKIEQRGDVHISSLQRYVEALGAQLRIDAAFPSDSELAESVRQLLGTYVASDAQYILPIFGDDPSPRRDVILSVKPIYSDKIIRGIKTVELRRRFPVSTDRGLRAYIYSTSPVRAVVGAAEIANVEKLPISVLWRRHGKSASIRKADFDAYFRGLDEGFALKIAKAWSFSRPIELN